MNLFKFWNIFQLFHVETIRNEWNGKQNPVAAKIECRFVIFPPQKLHKKWWKMGCRLLKAKYVHKARNWTIKLPVRRHGKIEHVNMHHSEKVEYNGALLSTTWLFLLNWNHPMELALVWSIIWHKLKMKKKHWKKTF